MKTSNKGQWTLKNEKNVSGRALNLCKKKKKPIVASWHTPADTKIGPQCVHVSSAG